MNKGLHPIKSDMKRHRTYFSRENKFQAWGYRCHKCGDRLTCVRYNTFEFRYTLEYVSGSLTRLIVAGTPTTVEENDSLRNSCWYCLEGLGCQICKIVDKMDENMEKTTKAHDVYFNFK